MVTVTNTAPTADAGGPYTGTKNVSVPMDGSGSSDPDGTLVTWEWDCESDGTYEISAGSATGSDCSYGAVGSYTASLRVTDDDGGQDTDTAAVTIGNNAPIADAGGGYSGDEAVAITMDGSASSDPGGAIVLYEWDCANDGVFELSGSSPTGSCTYSDDGSYLVSIRVTDDDGASDTDAASVIISNVAPVTTNLVTNDGDEGSSLSFSVSAVDVAADTVTVTWDFGDGTTDTGDSVVHTFADDGVYTVVVTATDEDGGSSNALTGTSTIGNVAPVITSTAPVNALQGSLYSYQPNVVDPGDEVFVWTLSPGAPTGMSVDAATGLIEWVPTYDQSVVGSFTLILTVDDGDGDTDAESWTVAVVSLDTDGDGLPDAWETDNGLDLNDPTDAGADPDADGLTNLDEFGQGTDPNSYDGPTVPVLAAPLTGDEVSTDSPDLVLDNSTDPQGDVLLYDFEVYEDAALTVLVTDMNDVVETPTQSLWKVDVALNENQMYWWRARASDPWVSTDWTLSESFVINEVNEEPDVPSLTYPTGGETVPVVTPELIWTEVTDIDGDAVTYDVEVYDALGLLIASGTDVQGDGTEGGWTVNLALTEDDIYSWTARAVDEHGLAGGWAAEESFLLSTGNAPPFGTMFLAPDDGASIASASPDLVVSEGEDPEGGTLVYEFEVDPLPSFDSGDLVTGSVPASGTGQVVWDLAADGIELTNNSWVYARVRAVDEGNVASVPDTISFFVRGNNDAPNVPVLIAPENESVGGNAPTFEVEDPTDPEGDVVFVEFIVARDAALTDVIVQTEEGVILSGTGRTTWNATETFSGTLHWSARAVDEDGAASEWAEPWSYTVDSGQLSGDDDDSAGSCDEAAGCSSECEQDCQSSVVGSGPTPSWLLLVLLIPAFRRRRA